MHDAFEFLNPKGAENKVDLAKKVGVVENAIFFAWKKLSPEGINHEKRFLVLAFKKDIFFGHN